MTDSLWLETMLCLIGEAFGLEEYGDAGKLLYYLLTFRHLFFITLCLIITAKYFIFISKFPYLLVNGAVVNIRMKQNKIALWLAESEVEKTIISIGQILKNRLEKYCRWDVSMIFEVHRDTMEKTSSNVVYKYRI